ncbi:farnesyl pyrophosphate synthase-like [Solenopsis invicta]|uniref:farnesyl pyrophosphate synthase-like n=1 Tax=Solenopsis invicta TaxID=13686 RepID=UPI00193CB3B1|nr:farnesyl pyrophosphate synthase-like [Solenopsis invicta]
MENNIRPISGYAVNQLRQKPNLALFTMDRYKSIVEYKTTYYTFIWPVTSAMHLAGIKDPETFECAEHILFEIGYLFQIQDDCLAFFKDSKTFGKDNTDIQEGKCTWLIVEALQRATSKQREILEECYGVADPQK